MKSKKKTKRFKRKSMKEWDITLNLNPDSNLEDRIKVLKKEKENLLKSKVNPYGEGI